jgi:pimeloyl-ACP methyl ester carboxylesterase
MLDQFETAEIQTGETSIFVRWSGSGPPLLLLHGFPQTHLMWREVAPRLESLLARRRDPLAMLGAGSSLRSG